jgi:acyl-coenzyme A synthetase/AMP-(fatty) acid ligase
MVATNQRKLAKNGTQSIRYFTNSGGVLPLKTLAALRQNMPRAKPYLMYDLTEAFRSSFLSPLEIENRPNSIGKAIPHAEILVLREDASSCDDDVGKLVHIGPLVTLGYWQNEAATSERFKVTPKQATNAKNTSLAVFSGDYVKRDADGFLYFISRKDPMIKTSGYRVSPTELESVLLQYPLVNETAVIAIASVKLEQVNIVGPLCTPLDILADKMILPKVSLGDYVVIFQSGAYGASASPKDFLSQPQVSEILL